jgi:hypothetical protein
MGLPGLPRDHGIPKISSADSKIPYKFHLQCLNLWKFPGIPKNMGLPAPGEIPKISSADLEIPCKFHLQCLNLWKFPGVCNLWFISSCLTHVALSNDQASKMCNECINEINKSY